MPEIVIGSLVRVKADAKVLEHWRGREGTVVKQFTPSPVSSPTTTDFPQHVFGVDLGTGRGLVGFTETELELRV